MEFFFAYPEVTGTDDDMLDAGPLGEVAAAAERAGFHGMSLTEHPLPGARWLASGGHQTLDPFVGLAFAAAVTTRLRLLTHLSVAPYRNPGLLAKAAATVDKLSGGRMVLGLGVGYHKAEFFALGVDFEERNPLFDEVLDVLPLHWSGEPFSYHGLHFDARDVVARPRPVQDPIPVWIGGNSRLSRRRAAERAQGWMPMPGGPELTTTTRTPQIADDATLAAMIAEVQRDAAAAGRGPIDISWTYRDQALRTDPTADADRHREAFASYEKMGVTSLVVSVRSRDTRTTLDFLEAFGATYLSGASPSGSGLSGSGLS
jgi:probable F420-dependent oxidoreductase